MAYVLLRRLPVANVAPATGYAVQFDQYDTATRRLYRDAVQATTNTGANAPFELTLGQLVPGASFCYGSTLREVRYAGDGTVSTHDNPSAPACTSNLGGLTLSASGIADAPGGSNNTGTAHEQSQQLTVSWSGAVGALTVRCALLAPGTADTAPFYEERTLPAGTTTALFPATLGQATVPGFDTRGPARRLSVYNPNTGLGTGRYRVEVTENATGATVGGEISVDPSRAGNPIAVRLWGKSFANNNSSYTTLNNGALRVLLRRPSASLLSPYEEIYVDKQNASDALLRLLVEPSSATRVRIRAWVYQAGAVATGEIFLDNATTLGTPAFGDVLQPLDYALPAGSPVGGTAALPVLSNGQGGAQQLFYNPDARLELANLILFHPPSPTAATGGVVVEVASGYDAHPEQGNPVHYSLYDAFDARGTLLATNTTGAFEGLVAGAYSVRCFTGVIPFTTNFVLNGDYGLRWVHEFTDLKNGAPCRLELWPQGYAGPSGTLCGQESPVTIAEEGIQGGDTQADFGPSVGKSMTMRLRAAPGELQDVMLGDRACRADFYYRGALQFTGFVEQGIYSERLMGGTVEVELVATCGLAGLKDLTFTGHIGQELRGRFPRLRTLLHCLSRTGLALPVRVAANLRAAEMLTDETPEESIYTDRLDYVKDDQRAVVDAICQSLGGTLVQRGGQWVVLSALEAAKPAAARTYGPAGTNRQASTVPAPTGRLLPAEVAATSIAGGATRAWYWLTKGNQRLQRRAGWKYYTGTADAAYAENAFRQGEYFGDADFWTPSATALRAEAGWEVQPGALFPIALVEAGGESSDVATLWPQADTYSDTRYIESQLAPVEAGREGLPFAISLTAKYVGRTEQTARVWVEIVSTHDANPLSLGAVLLIPGVASLSAGFTTVSATVPAGLLPAGSAPRVRVHAYTVIPLERRDPKAEDGFLLIQKLAVQVRPQGAKWDGKTAFVASGAGGSVRPTSPLEVAHIDAPDRAGLFLGTALAFRSTLTRGPLIPTTQWARADDLRPAPMLATQVLDVLALRGNPSRLLTGTVRHLGVPPELLDSVDVPYEPTVTGRRFAVGARAWHVKEAETDLTVVEIGEGELLQYFLPENARILDGRPSGRLRVRGTHRGIRITSGS